MEEEGRQKRGSGLMWHVSADACLTHTAFGRELQSQAGNPFLSLVPCPSKDSLLSSSPQPLSLTACLSVCLPVACMREHLWADMFGNVWTGAAATSAPVHSSLGSRCTFLPHPPMPLVSRAHSFLPFPVIPPSHSILRTLTTMITFFPKSVCAARHGERGDFVSLCE